MGGGKEGDDGSSKQRRWMQPFQIHVLQLGASGKCERRTTTQKVASRVANKQVLQEAVPSIGDSKEKGMESFERAGDLWAVERDTSWADVSGIRESRSWKTGGHGGLWRS